jgi:signal transduction histidine kinase
MEVDVNFESDLVRIAVRDDGVGIGTLSGTTSGGGGFGLFGARERLRQVGGALSVKCQEHGRGTEGIVTLRVGGASGVLR